MGSGSVPKHTSDKIGKSEFLQVTIDGETRLLGKGGLFEVSGGSPYGMDNLSPTVNAKILLTMLPGNA
jgi:hypothetical protein